MIANKDIKRLLIVGASILQLPAIKLAKKMGYYVGVIDFNPNAIGVPYADEFFNVSTIDIDGVVKTAELFKPNGIMTLATDMPMRSIAAVCEKLDLCGISFETAVKSTDKGEMIQTFEEHSVEHPWYYIFNDINEMEKNIDKIIFPCISKPTDNSGSRGVMLIKNKEELFDAFAYSSKNGRSGGVIIEEYMSGPEVSVEIMTINGQTIVLQVTDKLTTGAPHFVEMGHSQPSTLPKEQLSKIEDLACRAVKAVGIQNGPAHVEIILTKNGPKMVELGARMGGDCITTHLVPLSTGIDMVKATIQTACGEIPDIEKKFNKGSAIRYFNPPVGKIVEINGVEEAEKINGVCEIAILKNIGNEIHQVGSSTDRAGFVIAQGNTAEEAVDICKQVCEKIKFVITK